ncbi:restriction endonuclease subunit S [Paracidovorax sp. MALMAid1276]|uniref:restriction endonuclease subunit S n=1 Tax=Paracidovorax sp. MALMAid1276 TaxID=3411631 RepID=UPI003B9CBBED
MADLNPGIRADLLQAPDVEVSFLPMDAIGEDGTLDLSRNRAVAEVRNGYSYFEEGDVAFAKVTPCFENGKGALMRGLELGAGFGTTEITVLRPKVGTEPRFLNYVLRSEQFRQNGVGAMTGAGGLKRVPDEFTRDFKTPWPTPAEQERIANFLDEQTARIDALIAEKERLLQSLDELRDATCRSAFTRGLVSKTPLVESGEQFLGEIPVHWKVLPWKRLGYFTGGAGFPIEYQGVTTEELPFFKVKDLDAADLLHPLTETDNTVSRETATKLRANVFPVGTLTFAKVGAALLLMRVRRLGVPGCLDNNMMAFIPDQAVVDPLFAQLALGLLPLDWLVNPGAVPSVSASQVGEVKVALPALNEQRQIAAYVQSKFAEFAGVRSHLHEHIGRLREYRSSLISAAVTGQLDLSTFKAAE